MQASIRINVRVARFLCALVVCLDAFVPSTSNADPSTVLQFRKVIETGAAAPGTEPGVVFGALTTGLNHNLLVPKMDAAGRVAFMGLLSGPGVDLTSFQGMWAELDGTVQLVARGGQPAAGTELGVVFFGVPSVEIPFAPEGGGAMIAFPAQLTGSGVNLSNGTGIWKGGPGAVSLVARLGGAAPGLPGLSLGTLGLVGASAGHVLLRTLLGGPGVDGTNDEALFSDRNGTLQLVVREGDPAPSMPQGTLFGGNLPFRVIAFGNNSNVALHAALAGPGVNDFNDQVLYVERNGALQLVAREGEPAPGAGSGATFGGNTLDWGLIGLELNDNDRVAFLVNLPGTGALQTALYSDRGGMLAPVAISGQPAPGTNFNYSILGAPILNGRNQIAFGAAFPDDGDIFTPQPFGVFSDVGGSIAPIVSPDDSTPEGEIIKDARASAFNDAGQMLLILQIDVVPSRSGLWLRDTDGSLFRVAASGDQFDLNGDGSDVRQVIRVMGGGMNEKGQVAIRLDFSDNSSAHFVASLPCPSGIGIASNDSDRDGDVDLADFQNFQTCLGATDSEDCRCTFDLDLDRDVDLDDFDGFVGEIRGPV